MRRAAIPGFLAQGGYLLLRQRSSSSGSIRESVPLILPFDRGLVGMRDFGGTSAPACLFARCRQGDCFSLRETSGWTIGIGLSRRTANLEAASARNEALDQRQGGTVAVNPATAGRTFRGQDVEPLHHADILMNEGVAMHDKAPGSDRIKVRPKGNRSWRSIVDVLRCRTVGLETDGSRNNQRVMPFWPWKGDTVDLCHQNVVLMDMERMVRE